MKRARMIYPLLWMSVICALPVNGYALSKTGNWYASVGYGIQFPFYKSRMVVNNGSGAGGLYDLDLYYVKRINQPTTSLGVGYRWVRSSTWIPSYSLGLNYQHIFSRNIGGTVMQYSTPSFTNYTYDWEIASDVLLAHLKLNLYDYRHVSPYLLAGVGGAYSLTSNFSEGALPGVTPRVNPGFQANSIIQLAYRLGLGLDIQPTNQLIVSAEYQYQDIGSLSSKHGTGDWASQKLNLGQYRSNGAQASVTYLFN